MSAPAHLPARHARALAARSRVRCCLALLLALGGTAAADEQDTGLLYEFRAADWLGGAYRDPATGRFSHCQVENVFADGGRLLLGIDAEHQLVLLAERPQWDLPSGVREEVRLLVDGRELGRFGALGEGTVLAVRIGGRQDVFAELARGGRVRLEGAPVEAEFDLAGAEEALDQVKECADLALALPPDRPGSFADRMTNPFAEGQAPFDSSGQAPSRAERDLIDAWRFLLEQAGVGEFDFVEPSEVAPDSPPALAWQTREHGILGLLHVFPGGGVSAEEAMGLTLLALSESCEGGHYSGGLPSHSAGGYVLKAGSLKCLREEESVFATVAAVVDAESVTLVVHIAGEQDAFLIEEINARLLEVVGGLLESAEPAP